LEFRRVLFRSTAAHSFEANIDHLCHCQLAPPVTGSGRDLCLHGEQLGVESVVFHQLVVASALHHAAFPQHNDPVCQSDGGKAVGDEERHCSTRTTSLVRGGTVTIEDGVLGSGTGGLVENEEKGIWPHERPSVGHQYRGETRCELFSGVVTCGHANAVGHPPLSDNLLRLRHNVT